MIITKLLKKRGKKKKGDEFSGRTREWKKFKFLPQVRRYIEYRLSDGDTSAFRDVFHPIYDR